MPKRKVTTRTAARSKTVTSAQWDFLVEAYASNPGQHRLVARVVGMPERTCRTAWGIGLKSLPFGQVPISHIIEQAQAGRREKDTAVPDVNSVADALPDGVVTPENVEQARRRLIQNRMNDADMIFRASRTTAKLWKQTAQMEKALDLLQGKIAKKLEKYCSPEEESEFELREAVLLLKTLGEYMAKLAATTKTLMEGGASVLVDVRATLETGELRPKVDPDAHKALTPETLSLQLAMMMVEMPKQLARIEALKAGIEKKTGAQAEKPEAE
jgi:hypothetical protein